MYIVKLISIHIAEKRCNDQSHQEQLIVIGFNKIPCLVKLGHVSYNYGSITL